METQMRPPPPLPLKQAQRHVHKDPGFLAPESRGSPSLGGCEPEGPLETASSPGEAAAPGKVAGEQLCGAPSTEAEGS